MHGDDRERGTAREAVDVMSQGLVTQVQGESCSSELRGQSLEDAGSAADATMGTAGRAADVGTQVAGTALTMGSCRPGATCRRCHRGRAAAKRHSRIRRSARRCEAAWRQQEESRETASAAPIRRLTTTPLNLTVVGSGEEGGVCPRRGPSVAAARAAAKGGLGFEGSRVGDDEARSGCGIGSRAIDAAGGSGHHGGAREYSGHRGDARGADACTDGEGGTRISKACEQHGEAVATASVGSSGSSSAMGDQLALVEATSANGSDASREAVAASEAVASSSERHAGAEAAAASEATASSNGRHTGVKAVSALEEGAASPSGRRTGVQGAASRAEGASEECRPCGRVEASEAEVRAARRLQSVWRRVRPPQPTSIERGWVGAHARRLGSLEAHVRFLQYVFRRARDLRPGCWRRGGMRGLMAALRWSRSYRCGGGANLASEAEFAAQRERAERVLDWYRQYVQLLRRLMSGATPTVVDAFCGGGGSSEGVRRAGGASHGVDLEAQADFVRRFGSTSFTQADGVAWADVAEVKRRARAFAAAASPPCKFYSTARRPTDEASQPPLIEATRDMLEALFEYWWLENVLGARRHMSAGATELYGALFGLRVDRARLFETSFAVHVDEYLRRTALPLRARCCLGRRRRWRRLDVFGRPERQPCCQGNIFAVQGTSPWRCSAAECADAMGVDRGAMSYDRLAQSLPPSYTELIFSQMCMSAARDRFGTPAITFDDMLERPASARRELATWLRGAGDVSPSAGLTFTGAAVEAPAEVLAEAVSTTPLEAALRGEARPGTPMEAQVEVQQATADMTAVAAEAAPSVL